MTSLNETLARMKTIYKYGQEVNESNSPKSYTLEYHEKAADGKTYGIVRECSKYYIKSAQKGKETIAEAYNYLGGFNNKGNNEYPSYAKAREMFSQKMFSIREAVNGEANANINDFNSTVLMTEGTEKMQQEIARQRQIMHNAAMIMSESIEIGASRKNDVVKYDGKNDEAEKGKTGAEGYTKSSAKPDFKGTKTNGVKKGVSPFNQKPGKTADQLSEDCQCGTCDCGKEDWGSKGIGKGRDPKTIGWEMDGQTKVNEEENDWASKGLPSTPGTGEADTKKNNDPFNKAVNEGECCPNCGQNPCVCEDGDADTDVEDDTMPTDDMSNDSMDNGSDFNDDMDSDIESDIDSEDDDTDDIDMGLDDDDMDSDDDLDSDVDMDDDMDSDDDLDSDLDSDDDLDSDLDSDDDLQSQIESLQAQLDALKAKAGMSDDDIDSDDSLDSDLDSDDDLDSDLDSDDDLDSDLDSDDDLDSDVDMDDDMDSDDDLDSDIDMDDDMDSDVDMDDDMDSDADMDSEDTSYDDDMDECGDGFNATPNYNEQGNMFESAKRKKMNSIVESVVKKLLKEDELHVFGKHPGYRKKPMELPTTGEDKNQWGEDWNDESVHNEEPFGQKIGNGDPFNVIVNAVTKDVMAKIAASKSGVPIEGKKKAE